MCLCVYINIHTYGKKKRRNRRKRERHVWGCMPHKCQGVKVEAREQLLGSCSLLLQYSVPSDCVASVLPINQSLWPCNFVLNCHPIASVPTRCNSKHLIRRNHDKKTCLITSSAWWTLYIKTNISKWAWNNNSGLIKISSELLWWSKMAQN